MRSRFALALLCAIGLMTSTVAAAPPIRTGQKPAVPGLPGGPIRPLPVAGQQAKKVKYVVWYRDPDDVAWRKHSEHNSMAAAQAAAAQVQKDNPTWRVRVDTVR